ncbi:MAG: response regulator transcription factor [Pseudomonadota bacterium]|nr:response regulator transcription factor [Pseudomonadota bacterium]MDE3037526.1 response regulator transcription factor [Pseudomonadota bacterium]
MRLLLAEDDKMLGQALVRALTAVGYVVSWNQDGEAAELAALYQPLDAAILDLNLPKQSGLEVLRKLRARRNQLPVMILTAQDMLSSKVQGLDLGGDDYLTKPFDLDELLARLRSIIRRRQGRGDNYLRAGDIEYNTATLQVTKAGALVTLPPRELKLLALLMQSKNHPISKTQIESSIYGDEENFESNTVEVLIYSLRKKLGQDFIHTLRGIGYKVLE